MRRLGAETLAETGTEIPMNSPPQLSVLHAHAIPAQRIPSSRGPRRGAVLRGLATRDSPLEQWRPSAPVVWLKSFVRLQVDILGCLVSARYQAQSSGDDMDGHARGELQVCDLGHVWLVEHSRSRTPALRLHHQLDKRRPLLRTYSTLLANPASTVQYRHYGRPWLPALTAQRGTTDLSCIQLHTQSLGRRWGWSVLWSSAAAGDAYLLPVLGFLAEHCSYLRTSRSSIPA